MTLRKNICLLFLLLSPAIYSQSFYLTGKIINPKAKTATLEIYGRGYYYRSADTICEIELDNQNNFIAQLDLKESTGACFKHGGEMSEWFFEPSDSLHMELDTKAFDESLHFTGRGAEKNNYLMQKYLKFENHLAQIAQNYYAESHIFIDVLEKSTKLKSKFWEKYKDSLDFSREFISYEEANIFYHKCSHLLCYPWTHQFYLQKEKPPELPEGYYNFLKTTEHENDSLLISPEFVGFLFNYNDFIFNLIWKDLKKFNHPIYRYQLNKTLFKGEILDCALMNYILLIGENIAYDKLIEYYSDFNNCNQTPRYEKILKKFVEERSPIANGKKAPSFTLLNEYGEKVSLADFRGKVVYLDFWATWCAPCIRQIPYSKKLAETFKNETVVFINISIDKDMERWKSFINKQKMHGINLIATEGESSKVAKDLWLMVFLLISLLISMESFIELRLCSQIKTMQFLRTLTN